jgi:glycosyltransferase involved in cell wall biosynthesis
VIITVIITAYDRKEFIIRAIKSVLNQSISNNGYELIVVKNYNDKIIDGYIEKNGIKNIYSKDKSLGGKLAEAIKVSTGEIITFLEDDDAFALGKLEYVHSLFTNNKNLVYYHNSYTPVNGKYSITEYANSLPDFNMSCIAIKKEIINVDEIFGITDSIDTFMYLSAVESGKFLIINRKKLTFYMVHSSASNIFLRDFKDFNAARITYINNVIKTLDIFLNFFKSSKAKKYLDSQITYYRLLKFVYDKESIPENIINFLISSKNGLRKKTKCVFLYILLRLSGQRYRTYIQHRIYKRAQETR